MRLKKAWIFVSIALVAGISACLVARPIYHKTKEWRANALVKKANKFSSEGALPEALEKGRVAYALCPHNANVVRTIAKLYEKTDRERAMVFWKKTVELSGKNEDRKALIYAALASNNISLANQELSILKQSDPKSKDTRLAEARVLASQGLWTQARDVLSPIIPEAHELPREDVLFVVKVLLTSPQKEDHQTIISLLNDYPDATVNDKLLSLQIKHQLESPSHQPDILKEALHLVPSKEEKDLLLLGRWLNRQEMSEKTLQLIDKNQAIKRQDLFLVWLDAMAMEKRWKEIGEILREPHIPLENYLKLLFQARVYQEIHQTSRTELTWDRLRLKVANDPKKLMFIAYYATRLGLYSEARACYEKLTTNPITMRQAYRSWILLEEQNHHTKDLQKVLHKMQEAYPQEEAIQNDLLYINLLLKENIAVSVKEAEKRVQTTPQYLAYRITLALGYLREDKSNKALSLLEGLAIDWNKVRAGWRVVGAAVFQANGREELANALLQGVDPNELFSEERKLVHWH